MCFESSLAIGCEFFLPTYWPIGITHILLWVNTSLVPCFWLQTRVIPRRFRSWLDWLLEAVCFPRSIVCKAVCNMAAPGTGGVFALTWDRCSHKLTTTNMMRSLPLESTINSAFTLGHPDTEDKIQAFASTSTTNFTNKFDVDLLLTFLSVLLLIILRIKRAINYLCWQCMPKFLKGQKQGHKQCIEGC